MSHPEAGFVSCVNLPKTVIVHFCLGETVSKCSHALVSLGSLASPTLEDSSCHGIISVAPRSPIRNGLVAYRPSRYLNGSQPLPCSHPASHGTSNM